MTVKVTTENLECNNKHLVLYTPDGDINQNLNLPDAQLHFMGNHKIMELEESRMENNQNICTFKQICEKQCLYVHIYVPVSTSADIWKICEVTFI